MELITPDVLLCPKCGDRLEALPLNFEDDGSQQIWWTCRSMRQETCDFPLTVPTRVFWVKRSMADVENGVVPLPDLTQLPKRWRRKYKWLFGRGASRENSPLPDLPPRKRRLNLEAEDDGRLSSLGMEEERIESPAGFLESDAKKGRWRRFTADEVRQFRSASSTPSTEDVLEARTPSPQPQFQLAEHSLSSDDVVSWAAASAGGRLSTVSSENPSSSSSSSQPSSGNSAAETTSAGSSGSAPVSNAPSSLGLSTTSVSSTVSARSCRDYLELLRNTKIKHSKSSRRRNMIDESRVLYQGEEAPSSSSSSALDPSQMVTFSQPSTSSTPQLTEQDRLTHAFMVRHVIGRSNVRSDEGSRARWHQLQTSVDQRKHLSEERSEAQKREEIARLCANLEEVGAYMRAKRAKSQQGPNPVQVQQQREASPVQRPATLNATAAAVGAPQKSGGAGSRLDTGDPDLDRLLKEKMAAVRRQRRDAADARRRAEGEKQAAAAATAAAEHSLPYPRSPERLARQPTPHEFLSPERGGGGFFFGDGDDNDDDVVFGGGDELSLNLMVPRHEDDEDARRTAHPSSLNIPLDFDQHQQRR